MASIKVKFRPSKAQGQPGVLYFQIIHQRCVRQLVTRYNIFPEEWDERASTIKFSNFDRREYLNKIRDNLRADKELWTRIEYNLGRKTGTFTADDLIDELKLFLKKYSLFNYAEASISTEYKNLRDRTAEVYKTAVNNFRKFRNNEDILLDRLDTEIVNEYETWNKIRGICPNTSSFYIRALRAIYNKAVKEGAIEQAFPFKQAYTGVDKTVKRALPLETIQKICQLDLSNEPETEFARDMFILSFMLRGMSFIDMAYLKKSDLKYGYINYKRQKTGKRLMIEWTQEMQRVIAHYGENDSQYLLPIIDSCTENPRKVYKRVGQRINFNLKKLAKNMGLKTPLTLYVARHSWASIAKQQGIPINVISEGMGHESEHTTQIYLASLNNLEIDKANAMIINCLNTKRQDCDPVSF